MTKCPNGCWNKLRVIYARDILYIDKKGKESKNPGWQSRKARRWKRIGQACEGCYSVMYDTSPPIGKPNHWAVKEGVKPQVVLPDIQKEMMKSTQCKSRHHKKCLGSIIGCGCECHSKTSIEWSNKK